MRLSHLVSFALAIALHVVLFDRGREFFAERPAVQHRTALVLPLEFRDDPAPEPEAPSDDAAEPEPPLEQNEPEPEPTQQPEPVQPSSAETEADAELESRVHATRESGGAAVEPAPLEPEEAPSRPAEVSDLPSNASLSSDKPSGEPLERRPRPEDVRSEPPPATTHVPATEPRTPPTPVPDLRDEPNVAEQRDPTASTATSDGGLGNGDGIADFPLPPSLLQGPPSAELRFDRYATDFERNLLALGGRILVLPREQPRYFLELPDGDPGRAVRHTVQDGAYAPRAVALEDIPRFRRLRDTVATHLGLSASRLTIGFELPSGLDAAMQQSKSRAIRAHGLDPSRTRAVIADPTQDLRNPLDVRFFLLEDGRRMRAHPNY